MAGKAESAAQSHIAAQPQDTQSTASSSPTHPQIMSHPGVGTADGDAENSISEIPTFSSRASQDIDDASYYVDRGQEQEMEVYLEAWCEEVASAARLFAAQELSRILPPSESDPQLSLPESRPGIPNTISSNSQEQHPSTTPSQATWLPLTLRWPFLMALFCATLALGILTIALSVKSAQNKGLCNNSGSLAFSSTWRFLPTLIAVIYALLVQVLTNDVKRTEAFAKLSKPKGSSAASTLLLVAGPWWKDPFEALRKKRNDGHRSWTLFWVSIINIMAILLVSPLSAGLLSLDDVQISEKQSFNRLQPFHTGVHGSPLKLQDTATDETYFRTTSSVVQNLTTSAWLSDTHAVLPFWPAGFVSVPFGASLAGAPQQWKGQTSVFQAGLECTPMDLTGRNIPESQTNMEMESEDGCSINLSLGLLDLWPIGGGWWSNTTAPDYPLTNALGPTFIIQNNTSGCGTREMFFFANPFQSPQTNQSMAQLCSSDYFIAHNVTTTVENTAVSSFIRFDEIGFNQTKVALDHSLIDLQNFEELFLSSRWNAYFRPPNVPEITIRPVFGGPLILLAASLGFIDLSSNTTFESVDLPYHAQKVKQRFFGEALQAAFASTSKQNVQQVSAQVTTTQTRLVVSYDIGIALGSILIFSAAMINIVCYCSRLSRRPLNLLREPGSAGAVILMISRVTKMRDCFRGFDKIPETSMKTILRGKRFRIVEGKLEVEDDERSENLIKQLIDVPKIKRSHLSLLLRTMGLNEATQLDDDWRPAVLRRWTGLTLLVLLACLAAALISLIVESRGPGGLQQSALVFQGTLTFDRTSAVTKLSIAPYSIVPTIFAVAVKLWWGSLEEAFKRLQPYVTMAKRPTKASRGIALSYINSPMVLASGRALSKGHWLLALVCLGAVSTEIFTVGMSALWQRNGGTMLEIQQLLTQLEIRDLSLMFDESFYDGWSDIVEISVLNQVFDNPFTSWVNGAVVQLAYNGSEPAWSADGWSFAQVNLASIPGPSSIPNISHEFGALKFTDSGARIDRKVNVTLQTPAIRGRIDCSLHDTLSNTSNWLRVLDFQDASYWNETYRGTSGIESFNSTVVNSGYELLPGMIISPPDSLQQVTPTAFADFPRLVCCANETDKVPGRASIGSWSRNTYVKPIDDSDCGLPSMPTGNFTVKWIAGEAFEQQFVDLKNHSHFVWQSRPSITALNCQPVIETANASVTIELATGAVQDYSILDTPRNATNAWLHNFEAHTPNSTRLATGGDAFNVTISYGTLFMSSLYNAADCAQLGNNIEPSVGSGTDCFTYSEEDLTDRTFTFRLPGLNVDYMSYAMYSLARRKPPALLDPSTLHQLANRTFSTLFQHYASTNVTFTEGGRVFQPIGATLPSGSNPIFNPSDGSLSTYQDTNIAPYTNRTTKVIIQTHVEQLVMSPVAFILCLAILLFLASTAVLVYFPYAAYFKALPRDVESLASIIALVYDSPRLRQWVLDNEHSLTDTGDSKKDALDEATTGLGYFRGKHGVARWGLELEPVLHGKRRHPHTAITADGPE